MCRLDCDKNKKKKENGVLLFLMLVLLSRYMNRDTAAASYRYNKPANSVSPDTPLTAYTRLVSCISVSRNEIMDVIVQVNLGKVPCLIPDKPLMVSSSLQPHMPISKQIHTKQK